MLRSLNTAVFSELRAAERIMALRSLSIFFLCISAIYCFRGVGGMEEGRDGGRNFVMTWEEMEEDKSVAADFEGDIDLEKSFAVNVIVSLEDTEGE